MVTGFPHAESAVLDIRKLEDYCLNASHPRGRHKARVFRQVLDVDRSDAPWLRDILLQAARVSEAALSAPARSAASAQIAVSLRGYDF